MYGERGGRTLFVSWAGTGTGEEVVRRAGLLFGLFESGVGGLMTAHLGSVLGVLEQGTLYVSKSLVSLSWDRMFSNLFQKIRQIVEILLKRSDKSW